MKKLTSTLLAAVTSLLLTLVIAVVGILYAMFNTTGEAARTEALFGAVFFESRPTAQGVDGTMGLANPTPLLLIFLVVFAFCLVAGFFINNLSGYRSRLIQEGTPSSPQRNG